MEQGTGSGARAETRASSLIVLGNFKNWKFVYFLPRAHVPTLKQLH